MLLYFFILSSLCLLVLKSLFIYLFYFCHYIQVLFSYLITYLIYDMYVFTFCRWESNGQGARETERVRFIPMSKTKIWFWLSQKVNHRSKIKRTKMTSGKLITWNWPYYFTRVRSSVLFPRSTLLPPKPKLLLLLLLRFFHRHNK